MTVTLGSNAALPESLMKETLGGGGGIRRHLFGGSAVRNRKQFEDPMLTLALNPEP